MWPEHIQVQGFCFWKQLSAQIQAVYVTATFPFIMLVVLLVRGVTLPGALFGIKHYLYPNITRLADPQVLISPHSLSPSRISLQSKTWAFLALLFYLFAGLDWCWNPNLFLIRNLFGLLDYTWQLQRLQEQLLQVTKHAAQWSQCSVPAGLKTFPEY